MREVKRHAGRNPVDRLFVVLHRTGASTGGVPVPPSRRPAPTVPGCYLLAHSCQHAKAWQSALRAENIGCRQARLPIAAAITGETLRARRRRAAKKFFSSRKHLTCLQLSPTSNTKRNFFDESLLTSSNHRVYPECRRKKSSRDRSLRRTCKPVFHSPQPRSMMSISASESLRDSSNGPLSLWDAMLILEG